MKNEEVLEYVIEKAKKHGATDVDATILDASSLSSEVRLGKIISLERSEEKALGLRVMINQQQAIVSSADYKKDTLDKLVEQAIAMAKVAPKNEHLFLATKEELAKEFPELDLYDSVEPSAEELIDIVMEAEAAALENDKITNSDGASAGYSASETIFATSNGFFRASKRSSCSYYVSVIAGNDENMQTDYAYTRARHRSDLKKPKEIGLEAASRTIAKLNPQKIATSEMSVMIDARIAGQFLSYLASAVNGSSISRGTSFLLDSLENEIFAKDINIIDDPFMLRGLASRSFDAEGIAGKKRKIIENGVLKHYFLDLQTASKLKMKSTGHAVRGLASVPSPSCSNLYMQPGKQSREDMIKSIKRGILVTDTIGHGAKIVTGEYSQGATGFYIENGEIQYPVSEITIARNLKEIFAQIIPASDLKFDSSINSPSLLIQNMVVAGT